MSHAVLSRRSACQLGSLVGMILSALLLLGTESAQAQIGISSRPASLTLIARVPARAAIREVGAPVSGPGVGGLVEASVRVELESNAECRLLVRGLGDAHVWVKSADGEFRSLSGGDAVVVAHERNPEGAWSSEVFYRVEGENVSGNGVSLPVRYEVAVVPSL